MTKKPLPIEFILLSLSFIITGFAVLFIFKPPAKDYVKLIKWSPEASFEGVLQNSARRMYPILAETRILKVNNLDTINIESQQFIEIFSQLTSLNYALNPEVKDQFMISANKIRSIDLIIKTSDQSLNEIQIDQFYDSLNLEKIIKKYKTKNFKDKNLIFALYQTAKHEYTLNILKIR